MTGATETDLLAVSTSINWNCLGVLPGAVTEWHGTPCIHTAKPSSSLIQAAACQLPLHANFWTVTQSFWVVLVEMVLNYTRDHLQFNGVKNGAWQCWVWNVPLCCLTYKSNRHSLSDFQLSTVKCIISYMLNVFGHALLLNSGASCPVSFPIYMALFLVHPNPSSPVLFLLW